MKWHAARCALAWRRAPPGRHERHQLCDQPQPLDGGRQQPRRLQHHQRQQRRGCARGAARQQVRGSGRCARGGAERYGRAAAGSSCRLVAPSTHRAAPISQPLAGMMAPTTSWRAPTAGSWTRCDARGASAHMGLPAPSHAVPASARMHMCSMTGAPAAAHAATPVFTLHVHLPLPLTLAQAFCTISLMSPGRRSLRLAALCVALEFLQVRMVRQQQLRLGAQGAGFGPAHTHPIACCMLAPAARRQLPCPPAPCAPDAAHRTQPVCRVSCTPDRPCQLARQQHVHATAAPHRATQCQAPCDC